MNMVDCQNIPCAYLGHLALVCKRIHSVPSPTHHLMVVRVERGGAGHLQEFGSWAIGRVDDDAARSDPLADERAWIVDTQ